MFEVFEGVLNKYNGNDKEVVIPLEVTSIGEFAFYSCMDLETVILHDGVTSIGQFAFYGCENLKTIIIPESVNLISAGAFSCCYSLEELTLPTTIRTLNKSTFYRCRGLKKITLPDSITTIDRSAFAFCTSLESILLPKQLKMMGDTVFEGCEALKKIELPELLTTIGKKVFFNCTNLKEIIINDLLKEVGAGAFQTYGPLSFTSTDTFMAKPQMFDENYMHNAKIKNEGNYQFFNCYLPCVQFNEWKPVAQIMLLVNYLETYQQHHHREMYEGKLHEFKNDVITFLVKEKRFMALNTALEVELFTSSDIEPYFEKIVDREEKAKIMEYKNKESQSSNSFDDLEDLLSDLF